MTNDDQPTPRVRTVSVTVIDNEDGTFALHVARTAPAVVAELEIARRNSEYSAEIFPEYLLDEVAVALELEDGA